VKYLGILIDEELNWCEHIKCVYNNVKKFLGIFYKVRYKLPSVCLHLYYATVYPHIQYGIGIYANTNKTYIYDLVVLTNKILRILQFKTSMSSVSELYSCFTTLQIVDLHEYKILILMHKYFYDRDSLPLIFKNYFITNTQVHGHNTQSHLSMHLSLLSTNYGIRCLNFKVSKL